MEDTLTKSPPGGTRTFLDLPFAEVNESLKADIAVLGIPYGMPYNPAEMANDQSRAPDALRRSAQYTDATRNRFDWDFGGTLFDGRKIVAVDCGNVTAIASDHQEHYRRAEAAARLIFRSGATLISLGGDHGVPIPVLRALDQAAERVTLVHVDAHMDWRDESFGVREGFRSTLRRASELPWIGHIAQIGIRGYGSLATEEIEYARAYGADIITAYEMHEIGIDAVLDRIPDGGPYYLTIDADGMDPSIMPAVIAQSPGGLDWIQIRKLVHGLVAKGRVLGMDLVEIAPSHDHGQITLVHAERLICNFIGACVRAGYYD